LKRLNKRLQEKRINVRCTDAALGILVSCRVGLGCRDSGCGYRSEGSGVLVSSGLFGYVKTT